MKYRYVIILTIVSFILGIYISWYSQDAKLKEMRELGAQIQEFITRLDTSQRKLKTVRSIANLKLANEIIGSVVSYDDRGAPRKYIGEELSKKIQTKLHKLEKYEKELEDPSEIKKVQRLKKQSKDLLETIEYNYL